MYLYKQHFPGALRVSNKPTCLLPFRNPLPRTTNRSGLSLLERSYGSSPFSLNCVSYHLVVSASAHHTPRTAFAVAVGIFRGNKGRSWSRSANVALARYIFGHEWDIHTLRSFIGVTTSQMYRTWTRSVKQDVLTDVLPEGAKLHWIGPRRDASHHKVFLFIHGESCSPCTVRIHWLICAENPCSRRMLRLAYARRLLPILT